MIIYLGFGIEFLLFFFFFRKVFFEKKIQKKKFRKKKKNSFIREKRLWSSFGILSLWSSRLKGGSPDANGCRSLTSYVEVNSDWKNKWLWNSFGILSLRSGHLLEKEAALMAMVAGHWLSMLKWIPTGKNKWLWNSFGILSLLFHHFIIVAY